MLADRFLETYATESLKAMARRRGMVEAAGANKAELIEFLAPRLFSREANRRLVQLLSLRQRRLLGALKARGGRASTVALTAAVEGEPAEIRGDLRDLIELGLMLYPAEGRPLKYRIGECERVWMDRTAADAVDPVEAHGPLPKLLADEPARRRDGTPGLFLADLVLLVVALEREVIELGNGGGRPGPDRSGWTRLRRSLLLPDEETVSPADGRGGFLYLLLEEMALVKVRTGRLVPDENAGAFFHRSRADQARLLFRAYKRLRTWNELQRVTELVPCAVPDRDGPTHAPPVSRVVRARARVLSALRRFDPQRWYAFSSLCREIQATHPQFLIRRRGEETGGHLYRGIGERGRGGTTHPLDLTSDWHRVEGRFIARVLLEPLSWIGVVDLGWQDDAPPAEQQEPGGEPFDAFRIRPEGAYLLGVSDALPGPSSRQASLMVQPDFDILSLSGETDTGLIYDLSRFAEFTGGDRVVRFTLGRPAAQRGFHDGWSSERIFERLATASAMDIPQNVSASLKAWEAAYRRFRIVKGVHLLEDPAGRSGHTPSEPGSGLIRLESRQVVDVLRDLRQRGIPVRRFDYESRPGHALVLGPGLRITRTPRGDDWLTEALLRRCARPSTGEADVWFLDRKAVAASRVDGLRPEDLQEMLEARSAAPATEIRIALRAWGGDGKSTCVGQATLFSCEDQELLRMLLRVPAVADCLEVKLADGLFGVQRGRTGELRDRLLELGVSAAGRTPGEPLRVGPATRRPARGGNGQGHVLVWSRRSQEPTDPGVLSKLVQLAIEERRRIRMLYAPDGLSPNEREITPLGLQGPDLVAYCHQKSAQRNYRMDHILSIEVLPRSR